MPIVGESDFYFHCLKFPMTEMLPFNSSLTTSSVLFSIIHSCKIIWKSINGIKILSYHLTDSINWRQWRYTKKVEPHRALLFASSVPRLNWTSLNDCFLGGDAQLAWRPTQSRKAKLRALRPQWKLKPVVRQTFPLQLSRIHDLSMVFTKCSPRIALTSTSRRGIMRFNDAHTATTRGRASTLHHGSTRIYSNSRTIFRND